MIPNKIACRGFSCTESIQTLVRAQVEKLEKINPRLSRCEVSVELQHRHRKGQIYHVHILLKAPQKVIVINREPEKNHAHEHISVAVRDAFRAAKRRLEEEMKIQKGFMKKHWSKDLNMLAS